MDIKSGYFPNTCQIRYVNAKGETKQYLVRGATGKDKLRSGQYVNDSKEWRRKQLEDYDNLVVFDTARGFCITMKASKIVWLDQPRFM